MGVNASAARVLGAGAARDGPPAGRREAVETGGDGHALVDAVRGVTAAARQALEVDVDGARAAVLTAALSASQEAEAALAAVRARLVAAHGRTRVADRDGASDTTSWLKDTLRLSGRKAARQRRLAGGLSMLPRTAQGLADGELTPEHAEHIAGAMRRGRLGLPSDTEDALMDAAATSTPERLRDEIAGSSSRPTVARCSRTRSVPTRAAVPPCVDVMSATACGCCTPRAGRSGQQGKAPETRSR